MTKRTHELTLQWEAHKRAAQDARDIAADHEAQADRIWADLLLLSQRHTGAPQDAKPTPAATHTGSAFNSLRHWRREAE